MGYFTLFSGGNLSRSSGLGDSKASGRTPALTIGAFITCSWLRSKRRKTFVLFSTPPGGFLFLSGRCLGRLGEGVVRITPGLTTGRGREGRDFAFPGLGCPGLRVGPDGRGISSRSIGLLRGFGFPGLRVGPNGRGGSSRSVGLLRAFGSPGLPWGLGLPGLLVGPDGRGGSSKSPGVATGLRFLGLRDGLPVKATEGLGPGLSRSLGGGTGGPCEFAGSFFGLRGLLEGLL